MQLQVIARWGGNWIYKEEIENEGLRYIGGYVAKEFRFTYSNFGYQTKNLTVLIKSKVDWVD